jgi:hypothetical protein
MKPIAVVTGAVAFATLLSQPAPAEDLSSQIVGIWNVTSVECVGSDGEECSTPRANKRITRSGHYIKGCSSGRYTIEGSKVTIVYDDPPNFLPTVLEREVSVSGNLTMLKFTVATRKEVSSGPGRTLPLEKLSSIPPLGGRSDLARCNSSVTSIITQHVLQLFQALLVRLAAYARLDASKLGMDVGCQLLGRAETQLKWSFLVLEKIVEEVDWTLAGSLDGCNRRLSLGSAFVWRSLLSTTGLWLFRQANRSPTIHKMLVHISPIPSCPIGSLEQNLSVLQRLGSGMDRF